MRVSDIFNRDIKTVQPDLVTEADVEADPTPNKQFNPSDRVTMDIPLLLRIMEYSKEDAQTDMDLHHVAERLVELSQSGTTLSMQHYDKIVGNVSEAGDSAAEKLVRDVEYKPAQDEEDEEVKEGHGRYWCSTDKRWKERKGPKQSRG